MATCAYEKLPTAEDTLEAVSNEDTSISSEDSKTELNIALVGERESGKYSFINAILGLNEGDEGAARTGMEKTTVHKSYPHPLNPNVILWDLPGLNTLKYPDFRTYSITLYLDRYDAFLIFIKGRYTQTDLDIARGINEKQKPFFIVRTKVDNDFQHRGKIDQDDVVKKIKATVLEIFDHLKEGDNEKKVFLIDNFNPGKWDFDLLQRAIIHQLWSSRSTNRKINDDTSLRNLKKKIQDIEFEEYRGFEEVKKNKEKKLVEWTQAKIKIGIVGRSGVGKSSFVNALRGFPLKEENPLAAKTGPIEVTLDPTPYHYPNAPKITLWDIPGVGSEYFPDLETYCKEIAYREFDIFVIVSATRFTNIDKELAKKIINSNKPFLFVRTKIDDDIINERKTKQSFNEESTIRELKNYCAENLRDVLIHGKDSIFIISSHYPRKWDFPKLITAIKKESSVGKQQTAFMLSTFIVSENILEEKVKILQDRMWLVALTSVIKKVGTAEESYTYDPKAIHESVQFFSHQLGIPSKHSEELKEMPKMLQNDVQKLYLTSEVEVESFLRLHDRKSTERHAYLTSWLNSRKKGVSKRLQWLYGENNILKPLAFVYHSLSQLLDEMAKISLVILFQNFDKKLL